MLIRKSILILFVFLLYSNKCNSQYTDTIKSQLPPTHSKKIKKDPHWLLGNTWQVSAAIGFCENSNVNAGFGRSYFLAGGMYALQFAYGITFSKSIDDFKNGNMGGIYTEASANVIGLGFTVRGDYMLDFKNQQQYLKPSVGLNLVFLDLLYGYNFNLSGGENHYQNEFTIRIKCSLPFNKYDNGRPNNFPAYE